MEEVNKKFIPANKIKAKIEELEDREQELSDEQGYWGPSDLQIRIEVLQELLEEEEK